MPSSELTATSIGILRDMDSARRTRELRALRDHAPLDTLDAIISILETPEQELHLKAVQSLSIFRGHLESRAEAVAKHLVQNADPHVRLGCAILLMDNLSALITLAYRRALADPFEKVAQLACSEVGYRGGDGSTEALTQMLGHSSWRVRLEACKALISQGTADWQVIAALEAMAHEPEARIYDSECDEFAELEQQLGEQPGWGKLDTIIHKARSVAKPCGRAEPSDSPNEDPKSSGKNSNDSGGSCRHR
jgi:hypothetical protein